MTPIEFMGESARTVVAVVESPAAPIWEKEERLAELLRLVDSAGLLCVGTVRQVRNSPDPRTYFGEGKLDELARSVADAAASCVVFDGELTPLQVRSIEEKVGVQVVDRTQLILEIFAGRARTSEGKLQVELARLMYQLPRLTGRGKEMSRLGGGIGTRGPGETKLEVDRQVIRQRIARVRAELEEVRKRRETQRATRRSVPLPLAALVGYTNAGKSTLLNALTGANVVAEDRLFATLDPTIRAITLPSRQRVLLADTVGFIRDLPHHLVAAFRATLEEVSEADVLIHVVDLTSRSYEAQMEAVFQVLESLGARGKPLITAFNKCDAAGPVPSRLYEEYAPAVAISASRGYGLDRLIYQIDRLLAGERIRITLRLPYGAASGLLSSVYDRGAVLAVNYDRDGVVVTAEVEKVSAGRLLSRVTALGGEVLQTEQG